jgi:hypothetical protein
MFYYWPSNLKIKLHGIKDNHLICFYLFMAFQILFLQLYSCLMIFDLLSSSLYCFASLGFLLSLFIARCFQLIRIATFKFIRHYSNFWWIYFNLSSMFPYDFPSFLFLKVQKCFGQCKLNRFHYYHLIF